MTDLTRTLTAVEADYLAECEDRIERGLQTFVEVGTALAMIRDNKLYRAKYTTFALYCEMRWGFTDRRARQIIEAAEIGTMVPVENERQARALADVPEAERAAVWTKANESTGGKPTAAAIREAFQPSRPESPARRDPDPVPGSAVATPGGPAVDQPSATAEEAAGQPASPGPATGPREASTEVAPSAEAAGSSPDGDGLAVGQPAGDSHSSSEALGVPAVAPGAAGSSVEVSGETSTDGVEELRVPALQPDSSGAAGAPAHFPAAGAPDPAAEPLAGEPYDSLAAAFEYALIDKPGCRHDDVATCPVCLAGVAVHVLRDHVLDVLADDDRYHDWYRDNVEQLDEVDEDMSHAATVAHYLVDVVLPRSAT